MKVDDRALEWMQIGAVRPSCARVADAVRNGVGHFDIRSDRLSDAARFVADLIRKRFPALEVPLHARFRHFELDGLDRIASLGLDGRAATDLVVVSVLLDAGAGADWIYSETKTSRDYSRSEGLAIASLRLFEAGLFSSVDGKPLRVDGEALVKLDFREFEKGFQVSNQNPLLGVQNRHALLVELGRALESEQLERPSDLFPELDAGGDLSASEILQRIVVSFRSIWPGRVERFGVKLGDVWEYPPLGRGALVCFHKLSQWMTYSLVEPFSLSGLRVIGLDALTGLPEYRNGGLLIDSGVLEVKNPDDLNCEHAVGSEFVVEWRALTVVLLDELAVAIRAQLGKGPELSLGSILEGGTWAAGRELAKKRRNGLPPVRLMSDGTVF